MSSYSGVNGILTGLSPGSSLCVPNPARGLTPPGSDSSKPEGRFERISPPGFPSSSPPGHHLHLPNVPQPGEQREYFLPNHHLPNEGDGSNNYIPQVQVPVATSVQTPGSWGPVSTSGVQQFFSGKYVSKVVSNKEPLYSQSNLLDEEFSFSAPILEPMAPVLISSVPIPEPLFSFPTSRVQNLLDQEFICKTSVLTPIAPILEPLDSLSKPMVSNLLDKEVICSAPILEPVALSLLDMVYVCHAPVLTPLVSVIEPLDSLKPMASVVEPLAQFPKSQVPKSEPMAPNNSARVLNCSYEESVNLVMFRGIILYHLLTINCKLTVSLSCLKLYLLDIVNYKAVSYIFNSALILLHTVTKSNNYLPKLLGNHLKFKYKSVKAIYSVY